MFLGVMMIFPPFHRFFIHHPEELGIKLAFPRGRATPVDAGRSDRGSVAGAARCGRGRRNVPKYLLLGAIIPLHWLTFAYMSWQAAVPTVTIVHNLQYHALVWFHNRNRYAGRTRLGVRRR